MLHVLRTLRVAIAVVVAAVPIALADPHVWSFIQRTPIVAAYYPVAAGVVYALYKGYKNRRASTPDVASTGAPTMGAQ